MVSIKNIKRLGGSLVLLAVPFLSMASSAFLFQAKSSCPKCSRTGPNIRDIKGKECDGQNGRPAIHLFWVSANPDGSDGQCSEVGCDSIPCEWAGTLWAVNVGGMPTDIFILGPGLTETCLNVPVGQTCSKGFLGTPGGPPTIVAGCPNDNKTFSVNGSQNGIVCEKHVTFICGSCTAPPGE